jgi:hypothetical protein
MTTSPTYPLSAKYPSGAESRINRGETSIGPQACQYFICASCRCGMLVKKSNTHADLLLMPCFLPKKA